MRTLSKSLHHPTRLHTPENSVPHQLKEVCERAEGLGENLPKRPDCLIWLSVRWRSSSFDVPELDLEAESPAPQSGPAAESHRKPLQSKLGIDQNQGRVLQGA
jgi:hypothetical protein